MNEIRKFIMLPDRAKRSKRSKPFEQQILELNAARFLEILSLCQEMQILPDGGGLLDQDSYFVFLMKFALKCQQDRRELDRQREVSTMPRAR